MLGIFVANLIDPIRIVVSSVFGLFATRLSHVFVGAVVAGMVNQLIALSLDDQLALDPVFILLSIVSSGLWICLIFWIRARRARRTSSEQKAEQ
jgi:hypothetical protein